MEQDVFTLPSRFSSLGFCLLLLTGHVAGQAPAKLVRDFNRSPGDFVAGVDWLMPVEHGVVFVQDSIASGRELWVSNGTPRGTRLLRDIVPGSEGSYPGNGVKVGNKAAYRVSKGAGADGIWLTDGSEGGTLKLIDGQVTLWAGTPGGFFYERYEPGEGDTPGLWFASASGGPAVELNPFDAWGSGRERFSGAYGFVSEGSHCYFFANESELWRSDGTPEGTSRVVAADGAPIVPDHGEMVEFNGALYFVAVGSDGKKSLWKSDGSAAGTVVVKDWWSTYRENNPGGLAVIGDRISITLTLPLNQILWTSDGTTAGTREVQQG